MKISEQLNLSDEQYGILFDVRRSIRYHDRRRAFYEQFHHITSLLTILMAGSVLFDIAKPGDSPIWLQAISVIAAVLAALDMVVGYSKRAAIHGNLRERFSMLEITMIDGDTVDETWAKHQRERLMIEKDEPPIYRALDNLCRNEMLLAEGFVREDHPGQFLTVTFWQHFTAQLFRWADSTVTDESVAKKKQEKLEKKAKREKKSQAVASSIS